MKIYKGSCCNNLYVQALKDCLTLANPTHSRAGSVYDLGPSVFEFEPGKLNFLTLKNRALNPFFAIAEAAWVIGGENKLDILNYYIKSYDNFSDDKITLNGAYGFRLRQYFGFDQIRTAINELKESPHSRRCVLNMYGPADLINKTSKDIPCNTSIMLKIREGALDITIINRSNDIYWGIPYNLFVFQVLHCYLAKEIGVELGYQRHFTDSLHLYERNVKEIKIILDNHKDSSEQLFSFERLDLIYMILSEIDNINHRKFNLIKVKALRETMIMFEKYKNNLESNCFEIDTGNKLLNFLIKEWSFKYAKK